MRSKQTVAPLRSSDGLDRDLILQPRDRLDVPGSFALAHLEAAREKRQREVEHDEHPAHHDVDLEDGGRNTDAPEGASARVVDDRSRSDELLDGEDAHKAGVLGQRDELTYGCR